MRRSNYKPFTNPAIRNAPEIKTGFLPILSTQITAGIVAKNMLHLSSQQSIQVTATKTYAIPTTPVAKREFELPVSPKDSKIPSE